MRSLSINSGILGPLRRLLGNVVVYLAVVIASATAIWLVECRRAAGSRHALAVANADSTQWSLAQSEVEFLGFANTVARRHRRRG